VGVTPNGSAVIFEVEVTRSAPQSFEAAFSDGGTRGFTNGNFNFGREMQPVLSSDAVQVALGVEARRRGAVRPGLRHQLAQYSDALFRAEAAKGGTRHHPVDRHPYPALEAQDEADAVLAARTVPLQPSEGFRPQGHRTSPATKPPEPPPPQSVVPPRRPKAGPAPGRKAM